MQTSDPGFPSREGDAVLMLHGLFGGPENWSDAQRLLAGRWRVAAPLLPVLELPYHRNPLESLGEHVLGVMDRERIERAVLVGNSLGGHVAIRLAVSHPGRVGALILTGSSGLLDRSFVQRVPRRPSDEYIRTKMARIFHDPAQITPERVDGVRAILARRSNLARIVLLAWWTKHDNLAHLLPEVACPVLLVWGAEDVLTPPAIARRFQLGIPQAELHFIAGSGHAPMIERPVEFARLVDSFLERLAAPAPAVCATGPVHA